MFLRAGGLPEPMTRSRKHSLRPAGTGEAMSELAQWLVASAMVVMYAHQRFNTPANFTYSTTSARYYSALVLYVCSIGVIFVFLGGGISVSPKLVKMFTVGGGELPPGIEDLPGPLLAALLLTTLLPNFPVLSRFDTWLRASAWRIGRIPREAHRLSAQIRQSRLVVPADYRPAVAQRMAGFGIRIEDFDGLSSDDESDGLLKLLVQVTYLEALTRDWCYSEVRDWTERHYSRVVDKLGEDYRATRVAYDRLMSAALEHFAAVQANAQPLPSSLQRHLGTSVREKASTLNRELCDFVARGLLRKETTNDERFDRLKPIGFVDIEKARQPITFNDVLGVCIGVFVILFFPMLGLVVWGSGGRVSQAFMIPFMVAIIYGFAVVAAVYPKSTWSFANIKVVKRRPLAAYLVSGLLAMGFAATVSLVFRFLGTAGAPDFIKALESLWWTHPWLAISGMTAVSLAWMTDNYALSDTPPPFQLRIFEGVMLAMILAIVSSVVHLRLTELQAFGEAGTFPWWMVNREVPPWFNVRPIEFVVPISAGLGLMLGFTVPHLYRRASLSSGASEAVPEAYETYPRADTAAAQ